MRILITNDDGIHSPGLEACEKIGKIVRFVMTLRRRDDNF